MLQQTDMTKEMYFNFNKQSNTNNEWLNVKDEVTQK